jgi:hypothetical protein
MKAFIIITNISPSRNGMLVSTISAFVGIDSKAVDIIRQRYPDILIFNSRILEEKGHDYLASILEDRGSFIMLPGHRQFRDRCIYIGIDFSVAEQKERVLN